MNADEITQPIVVSAPKRSHKSKKEQRRKSSVRVVNGGFVERTRKPQQHGDAIKSQLVRVDAEFAAWVRSEAGASGISITEVTRQLFLAYGPDTPEPFAAVVAS
jgi:hypothetical protein